MLRAIRIFGPRHLAARYGSASSACDGYCTTCARLSDDPEILRRVTPDMERPAMRAMEEQIAVFQQEVFLARHAPAAFAHLAALGQRVEVA